MFKKITSLLLISSLLLLMSSSVFAVDTTIHPSVEEILNEYYEKSFAAQATSNTSTYARSGQQNTQIKQETMEKLSDAGYEAYDVNENTYDSVEAALQTDLSAMGLDPNSSYIIVVGSGTVEDNGVDPASMQLPDSDMIGGSYKYTYNGKTFFLRSITVAGDPNDLYYYQTTCTDLLKESSTITPVTLLTALFNVYAGNSKILSACGTFADLYGIDVTNVSNARTSIMQLYAGSHWTRQFIQVKDPASSSWVSGSCVAYVDSISYLTGMYFSTTVNTFVPYSEKEYAGVAYSPHYNDLTWQFEMAIEGYWHDYIYYDFTGDVKYYLDDSLVVSHKEIISW